jgi:hypothetical protein
LGRLRKITSLCTCEFNSFLFVRVFVGIAQAAPLQIKIEKARLWIDALLTFTWMPNSLVIS